MIASIEAKTVKIQECVLFLYGNDQLGWAETGTVADLNGQSSFIPV